MIEPGEKKRQDGTAQRVSEVEQIWFYSGRFQFERTMKHKY